MGFHLANSLHTQHLIVLMDATFIKRDRPQSLTFHSDQGFQYTSIEFKNYLKSNGIDQSFSRKGCPYDNSVCESFFSRLKKEQIYRHLYYSFEELEKSINEYINFYNTERPHGSLGNLTPNEFDNNGLIKGKENRQE